MSYLCDTILELNSTELTANRRLSERQYYRLLAVENCFSVGFFYLSLNRCVARVCASRPVIG